MYDKYYKKNAHKHIPLNAYLGISLFCVSLSIANTDYSVFNSYNITLMIIQIILSMHTLGKAMDFKLVDQNNKTIDTRVIAAVMQEIGFTGIGRITNEYIHGDVGTLVEHGGIK